MVSTFEETTDWKVAGCLWPEVRKVINKTNEMMKHFLTKNFAVTKFHLLTQQLQHSKTPDELKETMNRCLYATSDKQFFKKEMSTSQRTKLDEQYPADICNP